MKNAPVPPTQQADAVLDIRCLLNDLNFDALIAELEADSNLQPTPNRRAAEQAVERTEERRKAPRLTVSELGMEVRLTIPGTSDLRLVNISETGVLIETSRRLCPGKVADVFLRINGQRRPMRATIVRSTIHSIRPEPVYRTALHFEQPLSLQAHAAAA